MQYMEGHYMEAVSTLEKTLPILKDLQDASNFTLACYYIGKADIRLGNHRKADTYFVKIDSVFNKTGYLHPEVRLVYKYLAVAASLRKMPAKTNYYAAQWTKLDSTTAHDFPEISAKIFKDYDMAKIMAENQQLVDKKSKNSDLLMGGSLLITLLLVLVLIRNVTKEDLTKKALETVKKFRFHSNHTDYAETFDSAVVMSWEKELLDKLTLFKKNKGFLNPQLSVHSLAKDLDTNRTYLSKVIKKSENVPFNTYISNLRIRYITEKLMQNNKYLNYSIDALAAECGMTSRRVFYKHFFDINGMMPNEFINKIKKEQNKA